MLESSGWKYDRQKSWLQLLDTIVDLGIAASVLVAPLFMGGRGPLGRLVFIAIVCSTGIAWCLRQTLSGRASWRWSGVEWLLLAGMGIVLLQLVSLPQTLLGAVSPKITELLPIWMEGSEGLAFGTWTQVSLNPAATRAGLSTFVAYGVLFLLAYQRLGTLQDVQRLLKLIAVATCFAAVVAIAQFLFSNGKFLWLFEHPSRTTSDVVKGTFQNQNHLVQLLALGTGPILWWLATLRTAERHEPRASRPRGKASWGLPHATTHVLWVGFGVVMFAALLTFSRGGLIALVAATGLAVGIIAWKRLLDVRSIWAVGAVAGVMIVALGIFGYEPLARRIGTLGSSASLQDLSDGRAALWGAHAEIIGDFWLLGTGVGTHRDIYPTYLTKHFDVEFTHGESSYMQLLVETGLLGTGLVLFGIVLLFRAAFSTLSKEIPPSLAMTAVAIVPGLAASVLHSFGDFVWYIPACMTTTILLAAAAFRTRDLVTETASDEVTAPTSNVQPSRLAMGGIGVVGLALAGLAVGLAYPPAKSASAWHAYRRVARQDRGLTTDRSDLDRLSVLARHLENTVSHDPSNARAHVHLAGVYLQRFDIEQLTAPNPMPLSQIRDAALASQFPSREALNEWIDRAVGRNRRWVDLALQHARLGVSRCPLEGEGYTFLARLAFLESPAEERKTVYIEQALKTRPHHARVLYVAGQEALLAGDVERALDLWKRAFHQNDEVRDQLLRDVASVIPPDELLGHFEPDAAACAALFDYYTVLQDVAAKETVARYAIPQLQSLSRQQESVARAASQRQLYNYYAAINSSEGALSSLREAVLADPSHFETRQLFAERLLGSARTSEAIEQLEWCRRRRPDDPTIREMLLEAKRSGVLEQAQRSPSDSSRVE